MNAKTSFPLCWPESWQRCKFTNAARFSARTSTGQRRGKSMDEARRFLSDELQRLNASRIILSTNVELRIDGQPMSNRRPPTDPGAAVYFTFRNKPVTLACDKWNRVEDNVWAIACHIEALRGQERWGVGTIEQSFRGYMALPERSEASSWWKVLELPINATREQITAARNRLAKIHHSDNGGDDSKMAAINLAYAEATKENQ